MFLSNYLPRTFISLEEVMGVVVEHKWILAGIAAVGCGYVVLRTNRAISSRVLDLTKANVNGHFRTAFVREFYMSLSPDRASSHSHPTSSKLRTDAERSIDNFIISKGFTPYSVSTSSRDSVGQRLYYSSKDFDLDYRNDRVTDNHVLRMIDVDYYADMETWLFKGRPILLYTFVPENVGGSIVDGTFTISEDTCSVVLNGGGTYEHQLWNYNLDHFIIRGRFKSLMVKVDQVRVPGDDQRRIVCLTPRTFYWNIFDWLQGSSPSLTRRKITYGAANLLVHNSQVEGRTQAFVSIGYEGTPTSATIKYQTFAAIMKRCQIAKHPNISDIERYFRYDQVDEAPVLAPIVFSAFEGGWLAQKYGCMDKGVACGVAALTPHYQASGPLVTEDGEEIGVSVWQPILTGAAIFPRRSYNNDAQAIAGRVDDQRNRTNPPGTAHQYMREFVAAFPEAKVVPWSMSDVIEKQNKPLQRARSEQNKSWFLHQRMRVRAFMKKESYGKVTDPRNISTCTPSHTTSLSTFTYAAKEVFKNYHWFNPGDNPHQITAKVRNLVSNADSVLSNDYSRLDGTISPFLRALERAVYLRVFDPLYRDELNMLLASELSAPATTATGMAYDPGSSRLSGSPLTTDGNTLITAFVAYCALRQARVIEAGELHRIPGLFYGDDSLVVGLTKQQMEKTATSFGLKLKCEVSYRCQPLTYLSRVFVDPWTTNTSCQSPKRALGKIHLSCVRELDSRIVAHNKALGYLVTDKLTPLLSDYCRHVINETLQFKDYNFNTERLLRDRIYWSTEYADNTWPQEAHDLPLLQTVVADDLGISVDDLLTKIDEVRAGSWTPLDYPIEVDIPAAITGPAESLLPVLPPTERPLETRSNPESRRPARKTRGSSN